LADKRDETTGALLFDLWKEKKLQPQQQPQIEASGDMGWQGKGSGRSHASLSGHAALVASKTRKPASRTTLAKCCGFCRSFHKRRPVEEQPPEHECVKNHDGSSGSMEPKATAQMVVDLHRNHQVLVKTLTTDDDSSVKAKAKWSDADHMLNRGTTTKPTITNSKGNEVERPDHGALPRDVPEPGFLADPNHRKKTLKGELCGLVNKKVAKRCTLTCCDCVRLSTNFACMARTLVNKPVDQFERCGKAVLEHHFDNHEHCDDWCRRKDQTIDERQQSAKRCHCKTRDVKPHSLLQSRTARFATRAALSEVGHGMDTLLNESLNNSIAWLAPKNKVCSATLSLRNRVDLAVIINGIGLKKLLD